MKQEKKFASIQDILERNLLDIAQEVVKQKRIYHIVISPKKGMDSLAIEYQILEDTEN